MRVRKTQRTQQNRHATHNKHTTNTQQTHKSRHQSSAIHVVRTGCETLFEVSNDVQKRMHVSERYGDVARMRTPTLFHNPSPHSTPHSSPHQTAAATHTHTSTYTHIHTHTHTHSHTTHRTKPHAAEWALGARPATAPHCRCGHPFDTIPPVICTLQRTESIHLPDVPLPLRTAPRCWRRDLAC